ncbi:2-aminoadipate transaminase [bacterium BMS3Abin01]|nr:2-aminoadipate transaminase [bacterium BMS3Abin01]HDZ59887.1 PLP-dependent aminotransferase family protein [Actinomycetota bacterium]
MTRIDFDKYEGFYARRTEGLRSSVMRDLMAIIARPEIISLAGGLPNTESFPVKTLVKITHDVATENSAAALQYGPTEGLTETKRNIARVMEAEGTLVDTDDIIITTGGQQGIDLTTRTLVDPGDVIIAEAPTYPGAVPSFCSFQADVVQVPMDDDGIRTDLLKEELDRLEKAGRRPKFIYVIPNFHNPAGVSINLERRLELVTLARERQLIILEDNPYGLLRFEGEPLPTLYSLDEDDNVIYLSTFSKIISPGIRLGWMVAPQPLLQKFNMGKQAADLCPSTLAQMIVNRYFKDFRWQDYVEKTTGIYHRRRDAMLAALEEYFPEEAGWTRPRGGFYIWVTLPDYLDTTDLLARAIEQENVAFVPGSGSYMDGSGTSQLRLAFCAVSEERIDEGIKKLARVIREQMALYKALKG